jgi:hypothetical protein
MIQFGQGADYSVPLTGHQRQIANENHLFDHRTHKNTGSLLRLPVPDNLLFLSVA